MKLIKRLPTERTKKGYLQSYGLFLCDGCNKEVKRPLSCQSETYKSCGCLKSVHNQHKLRGEKQASGEVERRCLMCGKMFASKGPHNRRCKVCDTRIDQAAENTFYEPDRYSYSSGGSSELVLD
ncbi:MAG TPA: hypothetical protein ACFYEK_08960 [Candidatus Wunengus sp. YC60]|uniref:hypothetical protein n=1 Tax=Candidatus Wunengus sp. YC60 TaxID=3367697 RepID=UPI004025DC4A